MTRSEIPQLEVVTAIPDAEREDYVAQLLFSQGWSIIYRAFDGESLKRFMRERGTALRTVLVYQSDLPGIDSGALEEFSSPSITLICLDSIEFTSHEIMVAIRGRLRAPMLRSAEPENVDDAPDFTTFPSSSSSISLGSTTASSSPTSLPASIKRINRPSASRSRERRVIAVTGSTGAPGRTRFAAALAEEFSQESVVAFINADIRSHLSAIDDELSQKKRIEFFPLDREGRPTQIPEGDGTAIVDLGVLPGLSEAVTDRRWHGSLINNALDRASQLIYICKSTPHSVAELAQFLREYPLLVRRVPVTYICILSGHSRELREWEGKFLTLTLGESRYVLRESVLDPIGQGRLQNSFKLGNPRRKEIAKIATSLR